MYRQALQKDPENQVALNNLAWFLAMQEKSEESVALMAKLLEISGPVPEFVDTRGVVWLSLNKTSEALRDLAQAAQLRGSPKVFFHLAQAHLQADDLDAARSWFQKARGAGATEEMMHPLARPDFHRLQAMFDKPLSK